MSKATEVMLRRKAFDWPLLLFLLSAAWGLWIAYDRAAAWVKFWLIVGGLFEIFGAFRLRKLAKSA